MKKIFKSFKSPIKGILDIILIMGITVLAVVFLGPIIIDSDFKTLSAGQESTVFEYMCEETGRITADTLVDDEGRIIGWIDIQYHENGAFKEIIERNDRDKTIKHVFYSDQGEFLHWYEIEHDEQWNQISIIKYDAKGRIIS